MSLATWGLVLGALLAVAIPLVWTTGAGGGALLIPVYALILCPVGWLCGCLVGRIWAR